MTVLLWIVLWSIIGGIITPLVYVRKNRDALTGALLGLIVGAVGSFVLLLPLWLLVPRITDRCYSFTAIAPAYDPDLIAEARRVPSLRTCGMLVLEVAILLVALGVLVQNIAPGTDIVGALLSLEWLATDSDTAGNSTTGDVAVVGADAARPERPAPRALDANTDVMPTLTPIPNVPPQLITFPGAEMSARIVEAGRIGGTWETRHLGDTVGHLVGTSALFTQGNIVLAGHVENHIGQPGPFYYLFEAEVGDPVIISQGDRETYFEISEISIVDPYDVSYVAQSGPPRLTLITCTDWNQNAGTYDGRLVVIARPTTAYQGDDQLVKKE
jgi:LPXTG-site transpeptidase (sortase) family protein